MRVVGVPPSGGMKPTTPTIGTASDGGTGTTVSVAFTPSTYIGKSTITYTATSSPGSITGTGSGSPITVSGLTTGTAYTFTVAGNTAYGVASDASAASNSVTPANPSSFESIATATGTGSSGSITFSSIPSTYKHLQIRYRILTDFNGDIIQLRCNSDTGSNYAYHSLIGTGASATASGSASAGLMQISNLTGGGSTRSDIPSVGIVDIIDYASTSKYKTVRTFAGIDVNGAGGEVDLTSGLWMSTSAVSSITILTTGDNFKTTTQFALYGIRG